MYRYSRMDAWSLGGEYLTNTQKPFLSLMNSLRLLDPHDNTSKALLHCYINETFKMQPVHLNLHMDEGEQWASAQMASL
jgi:hypothetical protein